MSRHYVNSAWSDYYGFGGEVIFVDCSDVDGAFEIDARDVLSDPSVEDLEASALSLWPRGAAWGSPDGEPPDSASVIAGLTRALLAPLTVLYRRAWRVFEESCTSTIVESLTDWEREFGLPDPCVSAQQDAELRRRVLAHRVRSTATITPADVVRLAAFFGYVVALEEPESFKAGVSTCGGDHEVSSTALDQQFVIHLHDAPTSRFEAGIGEAGTDRLLDFDIETISCAINRIAPAWTYPTFSLAPIPVGFHLLDQNDRPLITETGLQLIAPAFASTGETHEI